MELRQLKHFRAVAETLHFGKAAEKLGMTQPPLSQSILELERELDAKLFARTKRTVSLTPLGEQWLTHVRSVLDEVENLPNIAQRIQRGEAGRLELSFVSTADYSVLPELVQLYKTRYPEVEVTLTEATSDIQIAALVEGRGHAGIIIPPADSSLPVSLQYRKLLSEPLIAAVPERWVKKKRVTLTGDKLSTTSLIGSPLILFPRRFAPAFYDLVTEYYASCGGNLRVAQQAIQMQTIISLVSAGLGIALVPHSLRNLARTGVRYLDLQRKSPELETGILWRRNDDTPTIKGFLETAAQITDKDL